MAQEIADSKLIDTWGSSGTKIEPDISKIIEGWQLGEQPPHEYMNWLQNTFGSKLNHILKNGVPVWNDTTPYLAGSSVQYSGNIWLCKVDNTNSEPTDANANWNKIPTIENLALTVDTINDFPASATTGDTCIVKDLDRGGIFIYDSTKVDEDNQGTSFNGWIRQYDGAVNVKWFGAYSDGTHATETTSAIQAAVEYVKNITNVSKKNIYIDSGRYAINNTIQLHQDISIFGDSKDIGYSYAFPHTSELIAVSSMGAIFDVTGSNISIANLRLYGNNSATYGLYSIGSFGRMSSNSFNNLSITLMTKSGIYLQNCGITKISNSNISNCTECGIDGQGWGDADIENCYISTINVDSSSTINAPSNAVVYGVGIRIRRDSSSGAQAGNINIRGGKIEHCRVGILLNAAQGVNITGVNFDTNRKASILLQSDTAPLPLAKTLYDNTVTTSIMINGNRFLGGLQGTQTTTAHIISNYSRFVTIAGNGFKRANDAAGDFFGSPVVGPDYGIWLYNSEECNITGNDLEASAITHCLVIQNVAINAARNRISGNSLDGSELIDNGAILEENAIGGLLVSAPNGALYNNSTKAYIENDGTKNSTLSVYTKAPPSIGGILQLGTTSAASSAGFFMIGQSGDGTNITTNNLFIKTNGNIENTNNSYGGVSDARLKEKIEDATNKLDDIMKVKIRNFHFIGNDEKQIGVIAQEIEEIFPSIVTTNIIDDIEIKSVKYSVLVPIMLKALQELVLKVEKLENSINIK